MGVMAALYQKPGLEANKKGEHRAAFPLSAGSGRHYYQPQGPPYPYDHTILPVQTTVGRGTAAPQVQL